MNKSYIYAGIGVVVVAVIAGVAFNMNKTGAPGSGSPYGSPAATSQTSMKDLLAKGTPQTCTFSSTEGGVESAGTVYVASGKMRGDFTAKTSGETIQSHMIVVGETAYIWSDQMAQGMKMSFGATNPQAGQANGSIDVNQQLNYSCTGWYTDQNDKFELPSGITFTDLSAAVQGGAGAGPSSAQCSQCNAISDASAKAQCQAALGCN